jgi:hypothetical protein
MGDFTIRPALDSWRTIACACTLPPYRTSTQASIALRLLGSWPSGTSETHTDLPADQLPTIREGEGIVKGRVFR